MKKIVVLLSFMLLGTVTAFSQEPAKNSSDSTIVTGERRRNPATTRNPHPSGIITSDRTKNPVEKKKGTKVSTPAPVTNDRATNKE